jgi:putative ABC transport system permease protein
MGTFGQDIRFGWRMLAKSPGFTAVAVLTLALGIGANSAIFSALNAVILHPLPFPQSDRLALVWQTDANRDITHGTTAPVEYLEWREQNHSFELLSAWTATFQPVRGNEHPEQVWVSETSSEFFRMLRVAPILGRDFLPDEETPGHDQVVLMSYGLWQRQFGGDPSVIGRTIEVGERPMAVIGVLPRGFSLFGTAVPYDLWKPMPFDRANMDRDDTTLVIFGRLKPGVTIPQAQAEMETIQQNQKRAFPAIHQENGVRVANMHDDLMSSIRPDVQILMMAVGAVLLIACANVANLMLARAATREKEIAIRTALGAGHLRIVRQLLTESVMMALAGGIIGVALAYGGVYLLRAGMPPHGTRSEIPHTDWITINGAVVAYTMGISLLTGIVFGLFPALQMPVSSIGGTLKESGRGTIGGRRGTAVRSALVIIEIAASIVLLIGAGLLIRSFVRMLAENLGLDPENVLTMQIWLPESRYNDGAHMAQFYDQALARISTLPGVESAGAVNFVPLGGMRGFFDFDIQGRAKPRSGEQFTGQYSQADPNYFRTMRIPLKAGREFQPADGDESGGVAIINEALERRYWRDENPLGRQIRVHYPPQDAPWRPVVRDQWLTIVGVVGDVREWGIGGKTPGIVYLPYRQAPSRLMSLVIRTGPDPKGLVPSVRQAILSVDKDQPIAEVRTMNDYLDAVFARRRLSMFLLAVFAGVATFLAAVGIYGLMSFAVTQRSHEIGIRMALGAEPRDVLRLILHDGMRLTVIGAAIGGAASIVAARYIASQLYGVRAFDPATIAGVIVFLMSVSLAACYVPARRATRVDPMNALRYE